METTHCMLISNEAQEAARLANADQASFASWCDLTFSRNFVCKILPVLIDTQTAKGTEGRANKQQTCKQVRSAIAPGPNRASVWEALDTAKMLELWGQKL